MSPRGARLVLWIALLATAPVPLVVVGKGWAPAAALAQLAAATFAVGIVERADGVVELLGGFLAGQAVVWALLGWLAAGVIVRGLRRVVPERLGAAAVAAALVAVVVSAAVPVYRSPFHATRARQTLLEVYR